MGRIFNVYAACSPKLHYMVNMDEQLKQIKAMIDQGQYFTINRARQYGKTTTLHALERLLKEEYAVLSLDFQMFSGADFQTEQDFIRNFCAEILGGMSTEDIPDDIRGQLKGMSDGSIPNERLSLLFRCLSQWCKMSERKIVLFIDEVDSASRYPVFLDFLAQLRGYYIVRDKKPIFQSVVLAGVNDIKNLKNKFAEEHKMNSPWNVAADFDIDLSLTEQGIAGMLADYEEDHHTGMDVQEMAGLIYDYTSGYPFLVSRICKLMDEKIVRDRAWTKEDFLTAVRMLLTEENTLFDSLDNKLIDYPDLKQMLQELLLEGKVIEYVPGNMGIRMAAMFGFVTIINNVIYVSNRIFETRLYNGFLAERSRHNELAQTAAADKNQFIADGHLNMELVIQKFVGYYQDIFGELNDKFLEDNGRCLFLLYIKPIINGAGNYYIEAKTRTNRRTDLIIDYCGLQHIVELKIWRGQEYNKRGEEQLADYLELYHAKQGYLVSFNFNKNKKAGVQRLKIGDKVIIEAVV